ncbi:MAG: carboxypeptidase M32 [Alphaproteobacteria bacterium]|nr:carboxypeptidase M32 [Alphaproteobacteria bacterium]
MGIEFYKKLEVLERRITLLESVSSSLEWDRAVVMPDGGTEYRVQQIVLLSSLHHELSISSSRAFLIEKAQGEVGDLDEWQKANLENIGHNYLRATALKSDLVESLSIAMSKTEFIWRSACEAKDFAIVSDSFSHLVSLVREKASALGDALGLDPYDALLDGYDRGLRCADFEGYFKRFLNEIPSLLGAVLDRQDRQDCEAPLISTGDFFEIAKQVDLNRALVERLGFDFKHGRLDTSHHPFSSGVPDDVRMTTRYEEGSWFQAVMASIHETGHSLYTRGLPELWKYQPVGEARGMILHESQSLCFEMQLARSRDFLSFLGPFAADHLGFTGPAWSGDNLWRQLCRVKRSLIRYKADEVTYPLHIVLRFFLEKRLIDGTLAVRDLPDAWSAEMNRLLGISPRHDGEGCLQDIHWYSGAFGYFPTYTLGAMAAAQFFSSAVVEHPEIFDEAGRGSAASLIGWMHRQVHSRGSFLPTQEVLKAATGRSLDVEVFLSHLRRRYLSGTVPPDTKGE